MRKYVAAEWLIVCLCLSACGAGSEGPSGDGNNGPSNIVVYSSSSQNLSVSTSSSGQNESSAHHSINSSVMETSSSVLSSTGASSSEVSSAQSSSVFSSANSAQSSTLISSSNSSSNTVVMSSASSQQVFSSSASLSSSSSLSSSDASSAPGSSSSESVSSGSQQSSSEQNSAHASCASTQWVSGHEYSSGDLVVNREASYRCVIAGWCANNADWAYEPGGGLYWGEAWELVAACDGSEPVQPQAPKAVSEVIAVASGNGDRVGISWTDRAENEVGFIVLRERMGSSGAEELARLGANVVTYTDVNVQPGESYIYQIISFNDIGESSATASNQVDINIEPVIPAAPVNVSVQQDQSTVLLNWQINSSDMDAFAIYRSVDQSTWAHLATVDSSVLMFSDDSVSVEITYFYRVTALNSAGESEPSDIAEISVIGEQTVQGTDLFQTKCTNCHKQNGIAADLLTDAIKNKWAESTQLTLLKKIKTMPVSSCDDDCFDAISDYLWLEQWQLDSDQNTESLSVGVRGLRLLTPTEYSNAIFDIFGIQLSKDELSKPRFDEEFKYPTQASKGVVLVDNAREYYQVSKGLIERLNLQAWGCANDVCSSVQLAAVGKRVFRRPLSSEEINRYKSYHDIHGAKKTVVSMLNSPYFLYLVELGEWNQSLEAFSLNNYEIASLLAFRIWGTAPDEDLLALADSQTLQSEQSLANTIDSMLSDGRFIKHFNEFIRYYTHTYATISEKPGLNEQVMAAMAQEQYQAVSFLLAKSNPSISELFNPGYTFLNADLANHYELNETLNLSSDAFVKVDTDLNRGGLLHQGFLHIHNSDFSATSIVKRGKMIRENMMCRMMGVPSGVDPATIELPSHAITTRERWDVITGELASEGQCWSCHALMNEPGSALENFDQTGKFRTSEAAYNMSSVNIEIDAAGVLRDNSGLGELTRYQNARELSEYLASSKVVRDCFVDSLFRFSTGYQSDESTEPYLNNLKTEFLANGDIKQLIKEMLLADFGLYRRNKD